jgi:hypothetical protein
MTQQAAAAWLQVAAHDMATLPARFLDLAVFASAHSGIWGMICSLCCGAGFARQFYFYIL